MGYKIVKYKKKRKCPFETYEPEKGIKINRQNTVPWVIKSGHQISGLGGLIGFWASGVLMAIKGFFSAEKKIKNFSFNRRVVEFKIKKK